MITYILSSITFRYLVIGVAGIFLAHVLRKTFGTKINTWTTPFGVLALMGFFGYGVLYQMPLFFFPAFGVFCFLGATALEI